MLISSIANNGSLPLSKPWMTYLPLTLAHDPITETHLYQDAKKEKQANAHNSPAGT